MTDQNTHIVSEQGQQQLTPEVLNLLKRSYELYVAYPPESAIPMPDEVYEEAMALSNKIEKSGLPECQMAVENLLVLNIEALKAQNETQTALIIQMREAVQSILDAPIVWDDATIPKAGADTAPYQVIGTMHISYGRIQDLQQKLSLTPSQAETKLRNKHIQECIEDLTKRIDAITAMEKFGCLSDKARYSRYGLKRARKGLQALIKKEGV